MTVLSIQSSVSFGYVGNSIAIPTLQKLGHDCWYIHTVYFSNHPGHEQFSGEFATPKSINKKIDPKITPEKVLMYNKLNRTDFEGDYEIINEFFL